MEKIFSQLHPIPPSNLDIENVIKFLDTHPQVSALNSKIKQKDWRTKKQ